MQTANENSDIPGDSRIDSEATNRRRGVAPRVYFCFDYEDAKTFRANVAVI
jgi:hypothetical protein